MSRGSTTRRARGATTGLIVLTAWTLFAFGGAYEWTTWPLVAGAVVIAIAVRPHLFGRGQRAVDGAICGAIFLGLLQLVPLRPSIRLLLSPHVVAMDDALRLGWPVSPSHAPPAPLTVDPSSTASAVALALAIALVFWCARDILGQSEGTTGDDPRRRMIRAVAVCGLILSVLAVVQHVASPHLLYGIWRPVNSNASPYGPFVNRNDLAAWLIMAIPLVFGYLAARLKMGQGRRGLNLDVMSDRTSVIGGAALWMMAGGVMVSLSRSGMTAGLASALAVVLLSRSRIRARGRVWLLALIAATVLGGAAYANTGALMNRAGETLTAGVGGRKEIWALSVAMARDFPMTGVGIGGYARAMSVYQPAHLFAFNHAHNEYLQIAVEGGIGLVLLAGLAIAGGTATIRRRLREDGPQAFWIRVGAVSALLAVGVQSVWETGLRMPANAVLFAVVGAIALGGRSQKSEDRSQNAFLPVAGQSRRSPRYKRAETKNSDS